VIGKNQHTLFHHSRSDGLPYPHQECPVYLTLHDGIRRDLNETFIRQNNEMFPVRMTATPIRDGQEITGAVVVFQDITDEMQRLQRLRLLETAVNATANSIVITDQNGTIEWINPAMSQLTGYSLKEAVGQNPRVLKSGAHEDTYYAGLWQTISAGYVWHGDVVNKRKDGTLYFEEMTITPVLNDTGSILHYIAVKQDVSERKRLERELQQLATTDPLTGTANRRHFLNRVEDELQRLKRYDGGAALLMLDLDHFKRVNDTWGHAIGDKILRHFTVLAQEHLRGTDLLGRLGGEEFAVLLPGTDLTGAVGLAERLRHHVASSPVSVASEDITYTVSIGVTKINLQDMSPDGSSLSVF
jgi:diguanylate cyclase (GGDEF)-like protein/PAS domain S-box-containing protein